MDVAAGDDVLAVVRGVVHLLGAHGLRATTQPTAALQQGGLFAGLGQPHGGGEPGQAASDGSRDSRRSRFDQCGEVTVAGGRPVGRDTPLCE